DFWCSLVEDAFAKQVTRNVEIQHHEQYFSFSIAPIADAGYVNLYGRDITEQKHIEQALGDSRARLAGIIDSAMDAIVTLDAEQHIILFNPAAEVMFGCKADDVVGQTLDRFIPERDRRAHQKYVQVFGETNRTSRSMGVNAPFTCLRANGDEFFAEITISQAEMAGKKTYTAILRDITSRIQAEQALRESEKHFRTLFEHLPIPAFTKNREGQYTSSNAENQRYWAVDPIGKTDSELLPSDEADVLREIDLQVMETGETLTKDELLVNTPLGTRQVIIRKVPLRDGNDNIIGILGASVDITERKQAEKALKRRVDELSALYKTTLEIISARDLTSLLNSIVMRAVDLLDGTGGGLYLCDPEKGQAQCVVSYKTQADYTDTVLNYGEGATGKVAAGGKPLIVDDYRTWDGRAEVFEIEKPFTAMISAPMLWKGQVTGVIHVLHDKEKRKFTEGDLELLMPFANHAAIAVENTRLLDETQRRLERLSTLRHIDQAISSSLDLRVTLNILLGRVLQQLEVDAAAVLLYRHELQMLEFVAGEGFHTQALQFTSLRLGEGFAGQAVLEQRTVHIADLSLLESGFLRSPKIRNENFVVYIGVPLVAKGNVVGVLEIYHRKKLTPDREWMAFLETLAGQAAIAIDNVRMFEDLQASNMQLRHAYDATIEGWARVLETRDIESEGHNRRVGELTIDLARKFNFDEKSLEYVRWGALLHDIGKMGIPDAIIRKPGPLTEGEWDIVRQHPGLAKKWLSPILYLKDALEIPYCHHEKWDGTGYPRGLRCEQIPLAARIFAVIDVWDSLLSACPYRDAWPLEKVIAYIQEQSGAHFDPEVVDAFLDLLTESGGIIK
ncbi:MAG: PAS domain S-box protein, partial [Gammaproteobacteria bacterium]